MPMKHLRAGDVVSAGYTHGVVITGRVVELRRVSDGKPFLMVEFTSGSRKGQRTWPDVAWQLGVGPLESSCERCCRRYRYEVGEDIDLCASCRSDDAMHARRRAADPDRPRTSWERKQLDDRGRKELVTT